MPAPAPPPKKAGKYEPVWDIPTVGVREWFFPAIAGVERKVAPSALASGAKAGKLTILHFNDVYEVGEGKQEPVGGAARFNTALQAYAAEDPLVLFSGDAWNPSLLSQVTDGAHMVEALNTMGVACSVIGNHDLDLGVDNCVKQISNCDFPWLCSNCWHKDNGDPLGGCEEVAVIQHAGYKIGVMGLIEEDWLCCCTTVDAESLEYVDFVDVGNRLCKYFKEVEGCDLIVALTHFREPNDERMVVECPDVDIVLGGHDHHYAVKNVNDAGRWYVKSGCDFKWLSKVVMTETPGAAWATAVEKVEITKAFGQHPDTLAPIKVHMDALASKMQKVIGELDVEIDARFSEVRTRETNCGNWCADVMRAGTHSDVGLLNSGTLRADVVYPKGHFTVEDLIKLLPFANLLYVMQVTGKGLLGILENGVSKWPNKDGRFPCVSNMKFTFDGNKPAGERVVADSVVVGGAPLDLEKEYSVSCLDFAAKGMEGYTDFLDGKVLKDEEQTIPLTTLMRNYFIQLEVVNLTSKRLKKGDTLSRAVKKMKSLSKSLKRSGALTDESKAIHVAPKLEGRIVNLAVPEAERVVEGELTMKQLGEWEEHPEGHPEWNKLEHPKDAAGEQEAGEVTISSIMPAEGAAEGGEVTVSSLPAEGEVTISGASAEAEIWNEEDPAKIPSPDRVREEEGGEVTISSIMPAEGAAEGGEVTVSSLPAEGEVTISGASAEAEIWNEEDPSKVPSPDKAHIAPDGEVTVSSLPPEA